MSSSHGVFISSIATITIVDVITCTSNIGVGLDDLSSSGRGHGGGLTHGVGYHGESTHEGGGGGGGGGL